ncbi:MAG TPA: hypothetical protein VN937_08155 [Blastocatellia bacterium]|nr:hypothetical protein [Blastocatellia bacterium]
MSKQDIEQSVSAVEAETLLDEMIREQGVSPVSGLDELSDLWPADDDPDRLMRYVIEERRERRSLPSESEQIQ